MCVVDFTKFYCIQILLVNFNRNHESYLLQIICIKVEPLFILAPTFWRGNKETRMKKPIDTQRVKGAQSKILVKSPEPGNKAKRMVKYKNYDAIIITGNYHMKLSASIYHHAKNVGIYPQKYPNVT